MSLQISVITAVFNRAATLDECLRSVQAQTWPGVEHIVVDGASTDGSLDIVRRHQHRLAQVVSEPDRGVYDALNKGIALATGDIVGFMHADDTYATPQALEAVARASKTPRSGPCTATWSMSAATMRRALFVIGRPGLTSASA